MGFRPDRWPIKSLLADSSWHRPCCRGAFCFIDQTTALHPLAKLQPTEQRDLPETFPTGV